MACRPTLFKFKSIVLCSVVLFARINSLTLQSLDQLHCSEGQFSSPVGGCHPCSICYLMIETEKVAHGCKEQCPSKNQSIRDNNSDSIGVKQKEIAHLTKPTDDKNYFESRKTQKGDRNVTEAMRHLDDLGAEENPSLPITRNPDTGYFVKGKSDTAGREIKRFIIISIIIGTIFFLVLVISVNVLIFMLCHSPEVREYKFDPRVQCHQFRQHGTAGIETKVLKTDVIKWWLCRSKV
ncbi:uncharacterized protein [Ptychodera flava]|uniref:uncharacterized protein isoform X2 n=1 Tax=Ptychodera flava TaxID=63121 RepID=UPI00396A49B1